IDRGEGIGVEVVPFDQIARGCADDSNDAPAAIGGGRNPAADGNGVSHRAHGLPPESLALLFPGFLFVAARVLGRLLCRAAWASSIPSAWPNARTRDPNERQNARLVPPWISSSYSGCSKLVKELEYDGRGAQHRRG